MKKIYSINEVNGLLCTENQKIILKNIIGEEFDKIDGLIKYKFYVNDNNRYINVILSIKKEYELIYAMNNELIKLESAANSAMLDILSYKIELLLLYK